MAGQSERCSMCRLTNRTTCQDSCDFRKHFPESRHEECEQIAKVFGGLENVRKMVLETPHDFQDEIVEAMYWEAAAWVDYPHSGPHGVYKNLLQEKNQQTSKNAELQDQLNMMRLQLETYEKKNGVEFDASLLESDWKMGYSAMLNQESDGSPPHVQEMSMPASNLMVNEDQRGKNVVCYDDPVQETNSRPYYNFMFMDEEKMGDALTLNEQTVRRNDEDLGGLMRGNNEQLRNQQTANMQRQQLNSMPQQLRASERGKNVVGYDDLVQETNGRPYFNLTFEDEKKTGNVSMLNEQTVRRNVVDPRGLMCGNNEQVRIQIEQQLLQQLWAYKRRKNVVGYGDPVQVTNRRPNALTLNEQMARKNDEDQRGLMCGNNKLVRNQQIANMPRQQLNSMQQQPRAYERGKNVVGHGDPVQETNRPVFHNFLLKDEEETANASTLNERMVRRNDENLGGLLGVNNEQVRNNQDAQVNEQQRDGNKQPIELPQKRGRPGPRS